MNTKNTGIALIQEIADLSKEAMLDMESMQAAADIYRLAPSEEMKELLFKYSGILSAAVATRVSHILLSESEFAHVAAEIEMYDEIEREVMGN